MLEYDSSAPNGWGFANRYLNFNEDTILPPICWEDCIECLQTTWDCDGQGNCFDPGDEEVDSLQHFHSVNQFVLLKHGTVTLLMVVFL